MYIYIFENYTLRRVACLLHIGTNYINNHASDKVNAEKSGEYITSIDKCFISFWMKEVIMSLVNTFYTDYE